MLTSEQELAIQVTDFDRIQINDSDGFDTTQDQIFQNFTANATSSDEQDGFRWHRSSMIIWTPIIMSHCVN